MNTLQICPPYLSDVATFQKSHFSTLLFIYFTLFMLPQKKTNSNCCTEALRVYLLLFSASYYLHSPSTASGARYRRSACIDILIWTCWGLWQWLVATWAEFQHSVVYCATEQCRKDWKHVLTQKVVTLNTCCDTACLTFLECQASNVTTGSFQSHRWQSPTGSFQSLQRFKECNKPSVRWKSFAIHKVVW